MLCSLIFWSWSLAAQNLSQMGWPLELKELYLKLDENAQKNYILISVQLPTVVLDYRSSTQLKDSFNSLNFIKNFHPGHFMLGWKCQINGENHTSMTGFSGEKDNQIRKMFDEGWGLASIFSNIHDGYLESPQTLQNKFKSSTDKKLQILSLVIEISEQECQEVINELYDFASHPLSPSSQYGVMLSPKNKTGAVCNSFVLDLLNEVDFFKKSRSLFDRKIKIPSYLFTTGKSKPDSVHIPDEFKSRLAKNKMHPLMLFLNDWSESDFGNIDIHLIDSELFIFMQKTAFQYHLVNQKNELKKFNKNYNRGLWVKDFGFEKDQFKLKYQAIDSTYDQNADQIHQLMSSYLKDKKTNLININQFPFLIIENN